MKRCTICDREQSLDNFREAKGYKGGRHTACKACEADRLREWRRANPLKRQAQTRRVNDKRRMTKTGYYDPARKREWSDKRRNSHLQRKYGITLEDEKRMREAQGDRCAVCLRPEQELATPLGVDHCHRSGAVRAMLCARCNRALGEVDDDPGLLQRLVEYLDKHASR